MISRLSLLSILLVIILLLSPIMVSASHRSCPCKEPFTGYTYQEIKAKAQACVDCKDDVKREHAQSTKESSSSTSDIGLGDISHSRSEEIRRINKLRKKQLIAIQQKREVAQAKAHINAYTSQLNIMALSETGFKNMLRQIDTLIYKDPSANRLELQKFKDKVTKAYKTQGERKEKLTQQIKRKQQDDKAKSSKLEQEKAIAQIVDYAKLGGIPISIRPFLEEMRSKSSLSDDDRKKIAEQRLILGKGIIELVISGGDKEIITSLVRLESDLYDLVRSKPKRTEQERKTIVDSLAIQGDKDQRRKDLLLWQKKAPNPKEPDTKTLQELEKAKLDLKIIKALEDTHTIYYKNAEDERKNLGLPTEKTAVKANDVFNKMRDKEIDLILKYREILDKYPNNVQANYELSQILTYQGRQREARDYREKAFVYADDTQYKQIHNEMIEKFENSLSLHNKPNPKNSVFIQKVGKDFENKYFPETIKKESRFERIKQNEAVQWALFWINEKTKPIQTWKRETEKRRY